jgi:2-polyprenyl-6-methoxyphenol hydroxylase-like FAD-dependent oxidoreductase
MMAAGQQQLERLFPGFDADLAAEDTVTGDISCDAAILLPAGWAPRFETGTVVRGASRRLIEAVMRRRLAAWVNVNWIAPATVTDLIAGPRGEIVGVRTAFGENTETVEADLVVDASGRSSRMPAWLEELGYRRPDEVVVDSSVVYASRRFRRPVPGPDWTALMIGADPASNPRYGVVYPEEGGRWVVALAGAAGVEPPTDELGFLEFAQKLRSPVLYRAIAKAEALGPVIGFRNTGNRLRRYEATRLPANLLVLGDAAMTLNPIYGQGMTMAILGCLELQGVLARTDNRRGIGRRFQRRLAAAGRIPWLLATSQDGRHGSKVSRTTRLMQAYTDRLQARVRTDETVALAFFKTMHFLDLKALTRPGIIARVLAPNRRRTEPVLTDVPPAAIVG